MLCIRGLSRCSVNLQESVQASQPARPDWHWLLSNSIEGSGLLALAFKLLHKLCLVSPFVLPLGVPRLIAGIEFFWAIRATRPPSGRRFTLTICRALCSPQDGTLAQEPNKPNKSSKPNIEPMHRIHVTTSCIDYMRRTHTSTYKSTHIEHIP